MKKTPFAAIGMLIAAVSAGAGAREDAGAQTIYRCGNAYSQAPCKGGNVIDASETLQTRTPATAPSAAQRDARTAAILEQDRLRLEAQAAPAYIPQPQPPTPAEKPAKRLVKPHKPEQFTAIAPAKPGEGKKKKKKKKAAAQT